MMRWALVGVVIAMVACKKEPEAAVVVVEAGAVTTASATASASASASSAPVATTPAPSVKSFPGTPAGAKALLAEFVKPGADTAGLSNQLRPTSADYKALFDAEAAAKIDKVYAPEWDAGNLVVAPKPGQTEVKIWSATIPQLRAGTGDAKEFPGGYKQIVPHLVGNATIYRFKFVEPGKDSGMSFDGLAHVNGHWVIVPKPWRGLDDHH